MTELILFWVPGSATLKHKKTTHESCHLWEKTNKLFQSRGKKLFHNQNHLWERKDVSKTLYFLY
jgi:hypothetical protein